MRRSWIYRGDELTDLKITNAKVNDRDYYVIYPFGNINEPLLVLADWQLEGLMTDIGFKLVPIKNVRR